LGFGNENDEPLISSQFYSQQMAILGEIDRTNHGYSLKTHGIQGRQPWYLYCSPVSQSDLCVQAHYRSENWGGNMATPFVLPFSIFSTF
jgi:hypothetical protein